jgi:hypothetical protein
MKKEVERVADRRSDMVVPSSFHSHPNFRYFHFQRLDLTCEDRVTGLFDGGSELTPRSRPLFLPEDDA